MKKYNRAIITGLASTLLVAPLVLGSFQYQANARRFRSVRLVKRNRHTNNIYSVKTLRRNPKARRTEELAHPYIFGHKAKLIFNGNYRKGNKSERRLDTRFINAMHHASAYFYRQDRHQLNHDKRILRHYNYLIRRTHNKKVLKDLKSARNKISVRVNAVQKRINKRVRPVHKVVKKRPVQSSTVNYNNNDNVVASLETGNNVSSATPSSYNVPTSNNSTYVPSSNFTPVNPTPVMPSSHHQASYSSSSANNTPVKPANNISASNSSSNNNVSSNDDALNSAFNGFASAIANDNRSVSNSTSSSNYVVPASNGASSSSSSATSAASNSSDYTSNEATTINDIKSQYRNLNSNDRHIYATAPDIQNNQVGSLNSNYKQQIVNWINFYRGLYGMQPVSSDLNDDQKAQIGVDDLVAVHSDIQHGFDGIDQPNGVSDDAWQTGSDATEHSNLSQGTNDPYSIVRGYFDDSENEESNNTGHRAWILDQGLKKIGIGENNGYNALYWGDSVNATNSGAQPVAYPNAKVFPYEDASNGMWSLYLPNDGTNSSADNDIDPNRLNISVHDDTADQDMSVNKPAIDQGPYDYGWYSSINYYVNDIQANHKYTINISGLPNGNYTYSTRLFNLGRPDDSSSDNY